MKLMKLKKLLEIYKTFISIKVFTSTCLWLWGNVSRSSWSIETERIKKKNKDESFTVKTSDLIPIRFALTICYLESMRCESEYFCYIGEYYLDVFIKKLNEILSNWDTFEREMEMEMKENQKRKYKKATVSYLYGKK